MHSNLIIQFITIKGFILRGQTVHRSELINNLGEPRKKVLFSVARPLRGTDKRTDKMYGNHTNIETFFSGPVTKRG